MLQDAGIFRARPLVAPGRFLKPTASAMMSPSRAASRFGRTSSHEHRLSLKASCARVSEKRVWSARPRGRLKSIRCRRRCWPKFVNGRRITINPSRDLFKIWMKRLLVAQADDAVEIALVTARAQRVSWVSVFCHRGQIQTIGARSSRMRLRSPCRAATKSSTTGVKTGLCRGRPPG